MDDLTHWDELWGEAFGGPVEREYPGLDEDISLAIESGIGCLESYVNSGLVFDDGVGIITQYDAGDLQQANWFLGLAWESIAEREGIESDAWNEQGRGH